MDAGKLLAGSQIVPVVVLASAETAIPVAEALLEANVHVIEVTLRTEDALQGIEKIAREFPEMTVGAGSLRRPDQFSTCIDAGARFGVCPGHSEQLVDAAVNNRLPFIPGAATPSEMISLLERGYTLQKFFPAELAGGRPFLKAVGAPLPEIGFMPTGGVTPDNVGDYLQMKNVTCVGGTWITPVGLQSSGDFKAISNIARDAMALLTRLE